MKRGTVARTRWGDVGTRTESAILVVVEHPDYPPDHADIVVLTGATPNYAHRAVPPPDVFVDDGVVALVSRDDDYGDFVVVQDVDWTIPYSDRKPVRLWSSERGPRYRDQTYWWGLCLPNRG